MDYFLPAAIMLIGGFFLGLNKKSAKGKAYMISFATAFFLLLFLPVPEFAMTLEFLKQVILIGAAGFFLFFLGMLVGSGERLRSESSTSIS